MHDAHVDGHHEHHDDQSNEPRGAEHVAEQGDGDDEHDGHRPQRMDTPEGPRKLHAVDLHLHTKGV